MIDRGETDNILETLEELEVAGQVKRQTAVQAVTIAKTMLAQYEYLYHDMLQTASDEAGKAQAALLFLSACP
jgi:hypothetical protein